MIFDMKLRWFCSFLAIFLLFIYKGSFAQENQQAAITAINESRAASNAAIARHDIDGMSKYWLNDFVQTIGRGTSLTGKDTIIGSWKALFYANPTVLYIRKASNIIIADNGQMALEKLKEKIRCRISCRTNSTFT